MRGKLPFYLSLLTSLTAFSSYSWAATFNVSDAATLRTAIETINTSGADASNTINISGSFGISNMTPIYPRAGAAGSTVTINGGGGTLSGGGTSRGFMIESGDVTLNNITLDSFNAIGGAGGSSAGGGGAGTGGACFVKGGATLRVQNVSYTGNQVTGGAGAPADGSITGGGGGGLGGAGGLGVVGATNSTTGGGGGGLFGAGGNGAAQGGGAGGGGMFGNGGTAGGPGFPQSGGAGGGGGTVGSNGNNSTNSTGANGGGVNGGAGATGSAGFQNGNPGGLNGGGGGGLAQASGNNGKGGAGGIHGGGGGGGASGQFGAANGGAGGIFGGAGGSGIGSNQVSLGGYGGGGAGANQDANGGPGGMFGGGGGADSNGATGRIGGAGGFGAGGGGSSSGSATGGLGGTFGGNGGNGGATTSDRGGGGGGGALGGTIFLDAAANLYVLDGVTLTIPVTPLTGGAGGASQGSGTTGGSGSIRGQAVFILPNGSFHYNSPTGNNFTLANLDDGGLGAGTGGLFLDSTNTGTLTLSGTTTAAPVYSSPITISGGSLSMGTTGAGVNVTSITSAITNNSHLIFDLQTGNSATFSGNISGSGDVQQIGPTVTLTLGSSNTYSGNTLLTSGIIAAPNATNNTFSGSSIQDIATGATLNLNNTNQIVGGLQNTGNVALGTGTLTLNVTGTPTAYSGIISGTGASALVKSGTGAQTLSGVSSYTGSTSVTQGTLQIGTNGAIPNIPTTIASGATLDLQTFAQTLSIISGTGAITAGSGSVLTLNEPSNTMISTTISGDGAVTKTGAGTLTIAGINTYTGLTTVSAGILQAASTDVFSAASIYSVAGGATLDVNNTLQTVVGVIGAGNVTIGSGGVLTVSPAVSLIPYTGVISGDGSLVKEGSDTFELAGASTYTGSTTISEGILIVGTTNAIPVASSTTIASGATLDIQSTFSQTLSDISGVGAVTVGTGGTLNINNSATSSFLGSISGTGAVTKINTGDLTLLGMNTYSGGTTVSAGRLIGNTTSLQGTITNNSNLQFDQSTNAAFANSIGGSGNLEKAGVGVLTLTAASNYLGTTTITAGSLQNGIVNALPVGTTVTISSGATLDLNDFSQTVTGVTGGAVTLGSGTLIINDTTGTTVSSAISGTGGVNKTGVGTTIISGINTYTSGTEIDAGILQSSGTNTLASASTHDIASGATLDLNGTSQVVGGITGLGGITLGGGVLTLNNSGIDTYNGGISGAGSLIKANTGTQILAAASTYTGATTVSEGTLQVEANNAIPITSETTIASGATLNLNGANQTVAALQGDGSVILGSISALTIDAASVPSTYSGVISGLGSLTKNGPEDLTLLGANTYGGGTTVNAGTLIGNTTSLQGAITNNTLVEFDQSTDGTFSGAITGSGTLEKEGTGTLSMTGVTNVGGAFNINQGQVNFLNNTTISGGINVASGASMGGVGPIIAPITVSGTVAPGQSIGTLSVSAITFSPGSIFEVEIDANSSDLLQVTGTADISGATLNVIPLGGGFDTTETYTVITAGNVVGTFVGVTGTTSLPRYTFTVNYFPMSVVLGLALSELPFSSIVTSGNAGAAAAGFQTLNPAIPDVASVISFLNTGTTAQLQCDFDQLQSAMFNAIPIIQEATSVAVRSTLSDRLAQIHGNECWQNTANNRGLWITPLANFSKQKGRSQGSSCDQTKIGFHSDAYGVALGVDGAIGDIFVLGGALSYAHTNLHWDQSQAKSHINSGFGSVYGTVFSDLLYLDLGLTGAYNRFEGRRNIYLNNITSQMQRSAKHHNHASEFDGYLGLGATVNLDNIQIRPFGALEYIYIHETAYNENGANSLDLVVQKKNSSLLREQVGLAVSFCQNREMISWSEEIQLSYIHENRYQGRHTKERFMDSTDYFTVSGFLPNRNLVAPAISLSAIFLEDFSLTGSYEGEFGNNWRTQTGTLEFLWKF